MPRRRSPARTALTHVWPWLAWWAGSMVLWLLLTSTVNKAEALVGAGVAMVAATAAEVVRANRRFGFRPRARWLLRAWRIPIRIAVETGQAFVALFRHVTGRKRVRGTFRAIPFRHGGEGPRDGARRAVATVAVSVSPNTFVIGFDPDEDVVFVHQLQSDPEAFKRLAGRS
jgi:multisubunit Na+/H+ antiporter MnhE subunit